MDLLFLRKNGFFDFLLIDFITFLGNSRQFKSYNLDDLLMNFSENIFYFLFIISIIIITYIDEKRKILVIKNTDIKIFRKLSLMIINILTMIDYKYFETQSIKMLGLLYFFCNYNLLRQSLSKYNYYFYFKFFKQLDYHLGLAYSFRKFH